MRRTLALIAALMLLGTGCLAEEQPAEREVAHEMIIRLFAAAAGTNTDAETAMCADMTGEERQRHIEENAAYREAVLPWLIEALVRTEEVPKAANVAVPTADPEVIEQERLRREKLDSAFAAMESNEEGRGYLDYLHSLGAESTEDCLERTRQCFETWLSEIDADRLSALNADYVFWLYSPDSPIDYPVVQSGDNDRYLHRMFNGEQNSAGTLFVDYRNLPKMQDPNTLVYGHHMRNDSMFGSLDWYERQEFFEGHPYMLAVSRDEIDLIEIFSGYTTSSRDECYDIAISDEDDLRMFVETARGKSDFVCNPEILADDHLMTMSTCAYAFSNARYIVIGRLVPTWRNEMIGD